MKRFCFVSFFFVACYARTVSEHIRHVRASNAYRSSGFACSSQRYSELASKNPGDVTAHMGLGNSLFQQKQYSQAVAAYENALRASKTAHEREQALFNAGCAAAAGSDYQPALNYFQSVVSLNKNNDRARTNVEILKKLLEKSASKNKAQKQHNRPDQKSEDAHQNKNAPPNSGQQGKTKDSGNADKNRGDNSRDKEQSTRDASKNAAGQNAASKEGQQQPNNAQSKQNAPASGASRSEQKGSDNGQAQQGQSNKSIHASQRNKAASSGQLTADAALGTQEKQLLAQVQDLDQQGRRLYARAQTGSNSNNGADNGW